MPQDLRAYYIGRPAKATGRSVSNSNRFAPAVCGTLSRFQLKRISLIFWRHGRADQFKLSGLGRFEKAARDRNHDFACCIPGQADSAATTLLKPFRAHEPPRVL